MLNMTFTMKLGIQGWHSDFNHVISYSQCNPNIVSGALFTLILSKLILNSPYAKGARDVNNIRVTVITVVLYTAYNES